ncbi:MAG: hypothetical protein L0191_21445, partial [Acidobacteria bacterium]|nr:hypothetical protein [Acidobacteriota bacterium]
PPSIPAPSVATGRGKGKLTEAQAKYVEARGMGLVPKRAVKHAGLTGSSKTVDAYENNPLVVAAVNALLAQNAEESRMTRKKVMDLALEAINMARTIEDPTAMLRGVQELNKMLGFYAPESKNIVLSAKREGERAKLALMTEQELIEMTEGYKGVLEGDFEVVDGSDEEVAEDD